MSEAQVKATPRPWKIANDNYGVERIWDSEMDCDIASCEGDGSIPHLERKANTKLIVRAVNSHDKLLEALKAAAELLDAMETCHFCKGTLILKEHPVHCEDCPSDCENHEGPECTPIYVLHAKVRRLIEAAK